MRRVGVIVLPDKSGKKMPPAVEQGKGEIKKEPVKGNERHD